MALKRKYAVLTQLGLAQHYTNDGDLERAERACDSAILLMHGETPTGGLTQREMNAACDAFLKQTGFPTLAVAVVYIENWRHKENLDS